MEVESLNLSKTMNYDIFKSLSGNRKLRKTTINRIIRSIEKVGAIPNPIIVNEKMEVIDGQHRIEALKQLSLPVYYVIVPGLSLEHCTAMNISQSNWTLNDYIMSYAEGGNKNYINFLKLLRKYKDIGLTAIFATVTGSFGLDAGRIKSGGLICGDEEYGFADRALDYCADFTDAIGKMAGRRDIAYISIIFCYKNSNVDNRRLKDKFLAGYKNISALQRVDQCLDEISELYNDHLRGEKVYLKTEYHKYLESQYKWYSVRYRRNYLKEYIEDSDKNV